MCGPRRSGKVIEGGTTQVRHRLHQVRATFEVWTRTMDNTKSTTKNPPGQPQPEMLKILAVSVSNLVASRSRNPHVRTAARFISTRLSRP